MIFDYLGPVASLLLIAYIVSAIVFILLADRTPTKTLAWILVLIAFPLLGVIFYILFGRDWRRNMRKRPWFKQAQTGVRRVMQPIYDQFPGTSDRAISESGDGDVVKSLVRTMDSTLRLAPLPVSDVRIYPSGQEHFDQLIEDIKSAETFVNLEYFIWEHDELTARVTAALLDRIANGVEVRVLYDWAGSLAYKKAELHQLKKAGAKVAADMMELTRVNYRNHRKIAVIDGKIGYTGGMNMGQEYIDGGKHYPAWRDTQVRVTGPGVMLIQVPFAWRWLADTKEDLFTEKYFFVPEGDPGSLLVQLATDGPDLEWQTGHRAAMIGINEAQKRAWIQSPYFVPDEGMIYALQNAAMRGVDVRVMMTGWPDKKSAFWAAQTYWRQMLDAGVKVYTYDKGFMHAKTFLFDDDAVGIGTMNFDMRSFFINQEMVLWMYDRDVAARQTAIWEDDLKVCTLIAPDKMAEMGIGARLSGSLARLASGIF